MLFIFKEFNIQFFIFSFLSNFSVVLFPTQAALAWITWAVATHELGDGYFVRAPVRSVSSMILCDNVYWFYQNLYLVIWTQIF